MNVPTLQNHLRLNAKRRFNSRNTPSTKDNLKEIARSTLQVLEEGRLSMVSECGEHTYDIQTIIQDMVSGTEFYDPNSELSGWRDSYLPRTVHDANERVGERTKISVVECSTLVGARMLKEQSDQYDNNDESMSMEKRIGVLNFASAKNPGGGFINGAQAQEESIARSSTIYSALTSSTASQFFITHKKDPDNGFYSHSMLYIPRVVLFRSDDGAWQRPLEVDIISCAAVNAGVVRRHLKAKAVKNQKGIILNQYKQASTLEKAKTDANEAPIYASMRERMGRILYLFEKKGIRNLVLGSFGTGVFQNRVDVVTDIWKELLVGVSEQGTDNKVNARFRDSFDHVVFAILGTKTFNVFEATFRKYSEKQNQWQDG